MKNKVAKTVSTFDFLKLFPNNQAAINYLEELKWGKGIFCSRCGSSKKVSKKKTGDYFCGHCRKEFNIKTNTIMQSSRIGCDKWLYSIYLFVTSRKGISSLQLSKEVGITQKSAWYLLQRIREACKQNANLLKGIVEIDETYIGGKEKNKHSNKKILNSQGGANKSIVMGFKERGGNIKAKVIKNIKSNTLVAMINNNVESNSILCTDELRGYRNIKGYNHLLVNHSAKEFVNGLASTNSVESIWAVLKRGYNGTYHNFSIKHLQKYIDEFVFRLNKGNVKIDTMDRIKSLVLSMFNKPITYKQLING